MTCLGPALSLGPCFGLGLCLCLPGLQCFKCLLLNSLCCRSLFIDLLGLWLLCLYVNDIGQWQPRACAACCSTFVGASVSAAGAAMLCAGGDMVICPVVLPWALCSMNLPMHMLSVCTANCCKSPPAAAEGPAEVPECPPEGSGCLLVFLLMALCAFLKRICFKTWLSWSGRFPMGA